MQFYRLANLLRVPAIAAFSIVLISCGSGDGEDSVEAAAAEVTLSGYRLVFEDDFGGPAIDGGAGAARRTAARGTGEPLGAGNWRTDEGYGPNNSGWGNDEWQLYQDSVENVRVGNGVLAISASCAISGGVYTEASTTATLPYARIIDAGVDFGGNPTPSNPESIAVKPLDGRSVLAVDFQDAGKGFGGAIFEFASAQDISTYENLKFAIDVSAVPSYADLVVQLEDGVESPNVFLSSYTPALAEPGGTRAIFEIPLADFGDDIDLENVTLLGFWNLSSTQGAVTPTFGTIYLDGIRFSRNCDTSDAGKRDGSITSGKVITKDRLNVRYGRIQARIKMPSGAGMWPAFWTLGSDIDERPWPDAGEIDIVEMHYFYSDNRTTHFTTHWSGPKYTPENRPVCASGVLSSLYADEEENCKTATKTFDDPGDEPITDDFRIFEVEWNERQIVGKIDGIAYFTQGIDASTMEEFLKDHYLILNVAVGGNLGGPFGPSMSASDWKDAEQTDMLVDWVRVFEAVPASTGTLIDEEGQNLPYNRVINSVEFFNGGFADVELESTAIPALVGDEVMEVKYSGTRSENGGGVPAEFSSAVFSFNQLDLSDYDKLVFSVNYSQFPQLLQNTNYYYVDVTDPNPAQPFLVNLSQVIPITPGETYELKFRAVAPFGARSIIAGIGLNGGPGGGDFRNNSEVVPLTTEFQTFTYILQAVDDNGGGAFGDDASRVLFDLNGEAGLVLIDDVSLKVQGTSVELLTNGGFEASVPNKAPWINAGEVGTYGPITVTMEDSFGNLRAVYAGEYPAEINGDWYTYSIPLSAFVGVDIVDVNFIGFGNPFDQNFDLIRGTLYYDDIRFVTETCNALPTVEFDAAEYNPATSVGQVTVNDPCAAGSLVTVQLDNGPDQIFVGAKLDAAGVGKALFGLVDPLSVCPTDDRAGYIALERPSLLATYKSASDTVVVSDTAPGTTIQGDSLYFFTSDPTQDLAFFADAPVPNSFNYSVFGSGSDLNGAFPDSSFDPVFEVQSGTGYGAEVAQIVLINITSGFAANAESINFKIKYVDRPANTGIRVEFGQLGVTSNLVLIADLDTDPRSTSIGDGWYEISIPMSDFPDASSFDYFGFITPDPAPASGNPFAFLITDIFLKESVDVVPAACDATITVEPPPPPLCPGGVGQTFSPIGFCEDYENASTAVDADITGLLTYVEGWNPANSAFIYNYGPFPGKNTPGKNSEIFTAEQGTAQGAQSLRLLSDYSNGNHTDGSGNTIRTFNFYEWPNLGAADTGTYTLTFDAKVSDTGGIAPPTTAVAYIKTLDPNAGFAETSYAEVNLSNPGVGWNSYNVALNVDGTALQGNILQFGFLNSAANNDPSAILFDNVTFVYSAGPPPPPPEPACPGGVGKTTSPIGLCDDFEAADSTADADISGLLTYVEGWNPANTAFIYNYGPFQAQNTLGKNSEIFAGEQGAAQGTQSLRLLSDYSNGNHTDGSGNTIRTFNFYEWTDLAAGDTGTYTLTFDAKASSADGIAAPTTAVAYIKTLDPNNSFAETGYVELDLSTIGSGSWNTYSVELDVDGTALQGNILQAGFLNSAANNNPSAILFDNISFVLTPPSSGGSGLVPNGGFETGDTTNWNVLDVGAATGATGAVTNAFASEGTQSIRIQVGELQALLLEQVNVEAGNVSDGDTVNIAFDLRGDFADGGEVQTSLSWAGATTGVIGPNIATSSSDFQEYTYAPTVTGGNLDNGFNLQLKVVCGGATTCNADVYIDNIRVSVTTP